MGEIKKEANLFRLLPLGTTQDGARLLKEATNAGRENPGQASLSLPQTIIPKVSLKTIQKRKLPVALSVNETESHAESTGNYSNNISSLTAKSNIKRRLR